MTTRITGFLPITEVERIEPIAWEERFWAGDSYVHQYRASDLIENDREQLIPRCAAGYGYPGRTAFRMELSEPLGLEYGHLRRCPGCGVVSRRDGR